MGLTFGGLPCQEPRRVHQFCMRKRLPTDWVGLPNRFTTTLGSKPGKALFLMRLQELNQLNINNLNDLVFTDNQNGQATIKNLVFIRARCLTPSYSNATGAVYLVEARDVRHFAQNEWYSSAAFVSYNVRCPAGSQIYYQESTNGGAAWTWQQMLDDLWAHWIGVAELGASPQLPGPPDGVPENYRFWGVPAWQAYNDVLTKLGYQLGCLPTKATNPCYLTAIQAPDANFNAAAQRWSSKLMLDDYTIESVRGNVPASVVVVFPMVYLAYGAEPTTPASGNWASTPVKAITVTPAGVPAGTEGGSEVTLFDDKPALLNFDGTLSNLAALQARASEVATKYYQSVSTGGTLMRRTYMGIISDTGFAPGLQVWGLSWRETGNGYVTEINRRPPPLRPGGDPDGGDWGSYSAATEQLAPPDLARQSFPLYPPLEHPLTVTNTTTTTNVFDANVIRVNPSTLAGSTVEPCWAYSPNGNALTTGDVYKGRLIGPATFTSSGGGGALQRPLFLVEGLSTPAAKGVTITGTTEFDVLTNVGLALQVLTWDSAVTDPRNWFNALHNTYVTVSTSGYYLIDHDQFQGTNTGFGIAWTLYLVVNGVAGTVLNSDINHENNRLHSTVFTSLNAGDTVGIGYVVSTVDTITMPVRRRFLTLTLVGT